MPSLIAVFQMDIDDLLKQLENQQRTYHETLRRLLEATAQSRTAIPAQPNTPVSAAYLPDLPHSLKGPRHNSQSAISFAETDSIQRDTDTESRRREKASRQRKLSFPESTVLSFEDDSSDDESDESLYAQTPLPTQSYGLEDIRRHLMSHSWNEYTSRILAGVLSDRTRIEKSLIFPSAMDPLDKRTGYQQFTTYDIGADGSPLPVEVHTLRGQDAMGREMAIWHAFKDINADPSRERKAIGRIIIAREPSPVMFAALHHAYHTKFDMDNLFRHLVEERASSAELNQVFHDDHRTRRSFVFNFEYYTIIGEDCTPMDWQLSDKQTQRSEDHIPITRCSSVVALSLDGDHIKKLKNPARRAKNSFGYVHDPWASWTVLNIQCYPDWNATMEGHDSSRHYVNGPEAFVTCLLTEFRDAQKRYEEIYKSITKLVTPPHDFIFSSEQREKLLFEDSNFTISKRYFWAFQTLGSMNDSIKALIDSYEDTFTDAVWSGTHKTIWPMVEENSARSLYYKKKMANIRRQFEVEIKNLKQVMQENNDRRDEIKSLRDQLFSGTSIQESRKTVEQTEITIQQNYNIKVLTLVNIFFLPPTFVTSVFGMTNMPTTHHYWMFGMVVTAVCVPFFILIGSLNTTNGYHFWRDAMNTMWCSIPMCISWLSGRRKSPAPPEEQDGFHLGRSATVKSVAGQRRRENSRLYGYRSRTVSMDNHKAGAIESPQTIVTAEGHERPRLTTETGGLPISASATLDNKRGREDSQASILLGRLVRRKTSPAPPPGEV